VVERAALAIQKRLSGTQLAIWVTIMRLSVVGGVWLTLIGLRGLTDDAAAAWQVPLGLALLIFGIAMAVVIARQHRGTSKS
jgi:Na+-driven multidrug efflux pump